ncbi:gametogenetin-binding protein 1 isoform X2 [Mus pahari]|uniref:gametogenetin-binding protein 1 isoform X2 n=1 Tax=Mus pahari TaxID=10093 RepID=UPI000A30D89A|nr:gametogenetin-binding protein 1 isoform X2 [Mus pahari]
MCSRGRRPSRPASWIDRPGTADMSYHTRLIQTWDMNPKSRDQPDFHAQPLERREREHFGQALETEQGCLQWVPGPLVLTPGALIKEEEDEDCPIEFGDLKPSSCKVGSTPWIYFLGLYKQFQKSAMAKAQRPSASQLALKDGLPHEEKGEREEAVDESNHKWCAPRASSDESCPKWCAPRASTYQSPLQKAFRSTDTVGFVESELKKILSVQREARLWKVGNPEGRELLTQPDITLEEAGMVDGQHLLLEEMDEMGNWPPPE